MSALEEHLLGAVKLPEGEEERQRFQITDNGGAVWALRKLAKIQRQAAEIKATADAEVFKVKAWEQDELQKLQHDVDYFNGLLEAYHRRLVESDPDRRTIKLPGGELQIRAQQPEWRLDEATFLSWAKANRPDLVRVKEEPDKATLKKVAKIVEDLAVDPATGEAIPGVQIIPQPAKFYVKVEV